MSEEFKYTTKSEIIKEQLKEDFALEIVDPCFREAGSENATEIEEFCDELQGKFDSLIDSMSDEAREEMFFFRNPNSDITPTK